MTDMPDRMAKAVNGLLNRYLVRGADGAERPLPYNPVDYQTLRYVSSRPGVWASDIARHIGVPATTMQSALDRLVRKGLLSKRPSETDRRARCYTLTENGRKIHTAIEAQDRINMTDMLSELSERDQAELVRILVALSGPD